MRSYQDIEGRISVHEQSLDIAQKFIDKSPLKLRVKTNLYLIKYQVDVSISYPMRFLYAQ